MWHNKATWRRLAHGCLGPPRRTPHWSRCPPAFAILRLPAVADAQRSAAATTNHLSQPETQAVCGTGRLGPQAEGVWGKPSRRRQLFNIARRMLERALPSRMKESLSDIPHDSENI